MAEKKPQPIVPPCALVDLVFRYHFTFEQIKTTIPFALFLPSYDPPGEPTVEAPAKPLLSDDEDEIEEDHLDEAHYDSLEKTSSPPGDF